MGGVGRIAIFSLGLWKLRDEIAAMSGLVPQFGGDAGTIAGWGHKPTSLYARAHARNMGAAYVAFEDGFLRSIRPGAAMRPAAMVMDRGGIYYDARSASGLENLIEEGGIEPRELAEASDAMALLRRWRISKYNHAPAKQIDGLKPGYVLVIDQTYGDASIPGALASSRSFADMLEIAIARSGGRDVVAKVHPDALTGKKSGHLAKLCAGRNIRLVAQLTNPWTLLDGASDVHTVSSQLGFEALIAGKKVTCHGVPFYAGWGLTEDIAKAPARRLARRSLEEVFAAAYLRYSTYFDLWTRKRVNVATSIDQLRFLRDRYLGNDRAVVAFGISSWKRKPLQALHRGPTADIVFESSANKAIRRACESGADVLSWGRHANMAAAAIRAAGQKAISAEDGFLRSAGLGAAFTRSMSFSLDHQGMYYDASRPSDLEMLLQNHEVSASESAAAETLRQHIVANRLTKYNVGGSARAFSKPPGRQTILVVGQVADDEAVRLSSPQAYLDVAVAAGGANLALLKEARRRNPNSFIVYKPHPDVETVGRRGAIPDNLVGQHADAVLRGHSMAELLEVVDGLEVLSSLAGFEALLRGVPVTTHGQPFYSGWGLTHDLHAVARRTRKRTLAELVAIALMIYPAYYDPESGLPCPIDVVLERLREQRAAPRDFVQNVRAAGGLALARARYLWKRRRGG